MFDALALARPNIRALKPYSSARQDFVGSAEIYLDANENSLGSPVEPQLNRYPDPLQRDLKKALAARDGVSAKSIFIGNGSDEAIDLLIRVFCRPATDDVIICPPTYGMYRVAADVNDVEVREVPLTREFELDARAVIGSATDTTKLIFICSPNNPTGNVISSAAMTAVASNVNAIVVVDEAYADFSSGESMMTSIGKLPNVVVLRTLSKAYGLAAARVGIAYAHPSVIELLNKAKPPYNVSGLSQDAAVSALYKKEKVRRTISELLKERERLRLALEDVAFVQKVFASDANFLLVRVDDASEVYRHLIEAGIVVRDRSREFGCENCLRITVGTRAENDRLLTALTEFTREEDRK